MKKVTILILGLLICTLQCLFSQQRQTYAENFDESTIAFTSFPSGSWVINNTYSTSEPNSYRGYVPNSTGDSSMLTTPVYDFIGYTNVQLRFKHICKISPLDIARIEYREDRFGAQWQVLPRTTYDGSAPNYALSGFNSESYAKWMSHDSLALPTVSWWQEEIFDLTGYVNEGKFEFRFVLKHGQEIGTQISYGWLIDDFTIVADKENIFFPRVEFISPFVQDTVFTTGPFTITARVESTSTFPMETPIYLKYKTTSQGITSDVDSIEMTNIRSGVYQATILQTNLHERVDYSITASDILGNTNMATSGYFVGMEKPYGKNSVAIVSIDEPLQSAITVGQKNAIVVTIQNKGEADLDSAYIHWSVNGVEGIPYKWKGNLPWGYSEQINIDSLISSPNAYDSLLIWVSSPNGQIDPITDDDTLSQVYYGCQYPLVGDYTIGATRLFPTINEAIRILSICNMSGDVTFKIEDGIYDGNIDLTLLAGITGAYNLTITSLSNNRDNVIMKPSSGSGIVIGSNDNVTIEKLTIDASSATHAVDFISGCRDIVIDDCILLADTMTITNDKNVINKILASGEAENIKITNNVIQGGYYGFFFYGAISSTSTYTYDVLIENNRVIDQSGIGIYLYYINGLNLSNNEVLSRSNANNIRDEWRGIQLNFVSGSVNGNKIRQMLDDIIKSSGILLENINSSYDSEGQGFISNNEIILSPVGDYFGINAATNVNANILNNSVYMGGTGANKALRINNNAGIFLTVQNNNLVCKDSAAYPIYLVGTNSMTYLSQWNIDYNNYSAPRYIGYVINNKINFSNWKDTVSTDIHSVNIKPAFVDSTLSLELSDYAGLECPVFLPVDKDIRNVSRVSLTTMGCYGDMLFATNAALTGILYDPTVVLLSQNDTLKTILTNGGTTALTSTTINWELNGVAQQQTLWNGSLERGESDTVTLTPFPAVYQVGNNIVRAWVNSTNDEYPSDDTISHEIIICDSLLNGTYIVGQTGVFSTINEALERIQICGISGSVTLALEDGIYPENIHFSKVQGSSTNNTLTLTSLSGNNQQVIIRPDTNVAVTLGDIENLIIENITIDAEASTTFAVKFVHACANVAIDRCIIRGKTMTTASNPTDSSVIYKANGTGSLDNIRITNNKIEGFAYGLYLYGGVSNKYANDIVIDSNEFVNQTFCGMYMVSSNCLSVSHNQIISRSDNPGSTWYGMDLRSCNGLFNGNRIFQRFAGNYTYGMYLYYVGKNNVIYPTLITNNELILNSSGAYYGIYVNSSVHASILHNSVYMGGAGATRAIQIQNSDHVIQVKNNIFVTESASSYPIFIGGTTYLHQFDIDYNAYYAPQFVGNVGSMAYTSPLTWQNIVTSDVHSVYSLPSFIDKRSSLATANNVGIRCPMIEDMQEDINGVQRTEITTMGAYAISQPPLDIAPAAFVNIPEIGTIGTPVAVSVNLKNMGTDIITSATVNWSINGVIQTPIAWTGNLLPNATSNPISLTSHTLVEGENRFLVWTSLPNQLPDGNSNNDTLLASTLACAGPLQAGTYTVDKFHGDFTDVSKVTQILDMCGIAGAVTFSIQPGKYGELYLKNIQGLDATNTLTFISSTTIAEDVLIDNIIFDNTHDITIQNISVDPILTISAIDFKTAAININIIGCKIQANFNTAVQSAIGSFGINKSAGTGTVDNIRIIGNAIDGGYSGINFYGGTTGALGTNVVIDSNIITNTYYYGMSLYYANIPILAHNTILSRTTSSTTYWYGIYLSNCNGNINANRIRQRAGVTYPYGINVSNFNVAPAELGLITNNEIVAWRSGAYTTSNYLYAGIQIASGSRAKIYFNSIFAAGGGISALAIANISSINVDIRYNNLIAADSCFPIHLMAGSSTYNLESNNYYSKPFIGGIGSTNAAKTSLQAWRDALAAGQTDNSKNIQPQFIDSTINLELSDYTEFECATLSEVPEDINGKLRAGRTSIGCYSTLLPIEALLVEVLDWQADQIIGNKDTIKVVLRNGGQVDITEVTLGWSFNDTDKSPVVWSGLLQTGESTTITLNEVEYAALTNTLSIWINTLKNGSTVLTDNYLADDTITVSTYACDYIMNTTFSVGATGVFTTISEAVQVLYTCGMSGPVTFEIQDGRYIETVTLSGQIPGSSATNTLTFTSASNDASKVIIQRAGAAGDEVAPFILDNVANVIITKLTLDGGVLEDTVPTHAKALILKDRSDNIEIRQCVLSSKLDRDTAVASSNHSVIYKSSTSNITNIRIVDNIIQGGSYGMYIYAPSASRNKNILIQDNTIRTVDNYGIYVYYTDSIQIINNNIEQNNRGATSSGEFGGIYFSYNSGNILNNRIRAYRLNNGISTGTVNNTVSDSALIANNEIIATNVTATGRAGINIAATTRAKILHNSVYVSGTSVGYGLNVASSTATHLEVKNNNFVTATSGTAVTNAPIYLGTSTASTLALWDINYNNYYNLSGGNIGYSGAVRATLSDWKASVASDVFSTASNPNFVDPTINLTLTTHDGLSVPRLSYVLTDITGVSRPLATTVGAYHLDSLLLDIAPSAITSPDLVEIAGVSYPLEVSFQNIGAAIVTSANLHWRLNGGATSAAYNWQGNLAVGAVSAPFTIDNVVLVPGSNELEVWTSMPNNFSDQNISNDTLKMTIFACDSMLSGTYTVGATGDFSTIAEIIAALTSCGMNAPVTIALQDGIYRENVELIGGTINGLNATNTITFTSVSQDSSKAKIQRVGIPTANTAAFTLLDIAHIRISHLHLDATIDGATASSYTYAKALAFGGECRNIEITNCQLTVPNNPAAVRTATTSESTWTGIYFKSVATRENLYDIRILNNRIEGGASGIFIYGNGGTNRSNNIFIKNNVFEKIDRYGLITYCTDSVYALNNIVSQRKKEDVTGRLTSFYGISVRYGRGNVENNRIMGDSLYHGIFLESINNDGYVLCANNEIMGHVEGTTATTGRAAILATSSKVDIFHNSILVTSGGLNVRGIHVTPSTSATAIVNVKNNNIVTLGATHIPLYLGVNVAATIAYSDINYNNYYAPQFIGATTTTNHTAWGTWTALVATDVNSVKMYPAYVDTTIGLQITNHLDYICPTEAAVTHDKLGNIRAGESTMGAYNYMTPINLDASLQEVINVPEYIGTTDFLSPDITFKNEGVTMVNSIEISWTLNDNPKPSFVWNGSLEIFNMDTIHFPLFHPDLGNNDVVAWISSVNGSGLDTRQFNDTVRFSFFACDSLLSGNYIIGATGDFPTVNAAIERIGICGVKGDIVFKLQDATYVENWNFTNSENIMHGYRLTITSLSGNRNNVILKPASGGAIVLNNTTNLSIDGITIDVATLSVNAINFTATCTNVVINNCDIKAHPTTTTTTVNGIYKTSSTGRLSNVSITNNTVNGGYYGIYLYGGTGTTEAAIGNKVIINNNIVTNSYLYGIYINNTDSSSISYNDVQSRAGSTTTWHGIYHYNSNGPVCNNKIYHRGTTATVTGIYLYYYNRYLTDGIGLVANNDIIVNTTSTQYGIYVTASRSNIINNSILVKGTSASRGIYTTTSSGTTTYIYNIKNNNIVTEGNLSYPIYLNSAYESAWDINYNNYSAPTYVGYAGGNHASLFNFQLAVTSDKYSVQVQPNYINTNISLELSDYAGLECPRLPEVANNINDAARTRYTTMGAYGIGTPEKYDLALTVVEPATSNSLCSPNFVSVKLEVANIGTIDQDFSTDTINLHFSMTNTMDLPPFDTVVAVKSGNLDPFQTTVFELTDMLPVFHAGDYDFIAWITNPKDSVLSNDTVRGIYKNTKIALPFDDDFSTSALASLRVEALKGDSLWQVEQGSGIDSIIAPYYGTGRLVFRGGKGAMSKISTGQLELNRTQQPVLEFWYEHDNNNENNSERDYTDVVLTYDGGQTDSLLLRLYRYNEAYTAPTWERYVIDLSNFQDSSCVVISFLAFSSGGVQHMDRIAISSNQDLSVSEIIRPNYSICDLKNKNIQIVVTNETGQNIDFDNDNNNTELCVMITHNGVIVDSSIHRLTGLLEGLASDTIEISGIDLASGQFITRAYLTKSIDNNPQNDVLSDTIAINPSISVRVEQLSDCVNTFVAREMEVGQTVVVTNTGNMDLSFEDINLIMDVHSDSYSFQTTGSFSDSLHQGGSFTYAFVNKFIVPMDMEYHIDVVAYLSCDSALVNADTSATECVDVNDLYMVSINYPTGTTTDRVGDVIKPIISIGNHCMKDFDNVEVTALIVDLDGVEKGRINETINRINMNDTVEYTFNGGYTVPNMKNYKLIVYFNSVDNYNSNDTMAMLCTTPPGIKDMDKLTISMEQNIPNPANDNTIIRYRVPSDGEVSFKIYSVNGQILYNKAENALFGDNQIEINTASFAAGVYFYTMEFEGQRITKRMSIKR